MTTPLSDEQKQLEKIVKLKAAAGAVLIALAVGFISWHLSTGVSRHAAKLFMAAPVIVLIVAYRSLLWWMAQEHRCDVCHAGFSVEEVDREEVLISVIPRKATKNAGYFTSGPNKGKQIIQHENWTEEKYDVTTTFACSQCDDEFTEKTLETRKTSFSSSKSYH